MTHARGTSATSGMIEVACNVSQSKVLLRLRVWIIARTPGPDGTDPHHPVTVLLERIIRRGQRSGDFDRRLPATWLAAAALSLGHAVAEEIDAGRLTVAKATAILEESVLRLCTRRPSQ